MTIFNFISLFGGLALFLYGMQLMGDGLKKGSSGALKAAMEKVTNNPLIGFLSRRSFRAQRRPSCSPRALSARAC